MRPASEFAGWNTLAATAQDVLVAVALHKPTQLKFRDADCAAAGAFTCFVKL
jgi:hypothetical protein